MPNTCCSWQPISVRDTRGERRGQARSANLQQLQRLQLRVAAPFMNSLQPQADRRRHQRRDVNLMFFDQRETQRGARVSGEDHPAAGEKTPSDPGELIA